MITADAKNKYRKLIWVIIIDLTLIAAIIFYFAFIRPHPALKINGILIEKPQDIPAFHLINNHGKPFTLNNLRGQWSLVYFGFTRCPMICPTTMDVLNKTYAILQHHLPTNQLPQIIFISIDPNTDTLPRLNHFINAVNNRFIAVRGSVEETMKLTKQLHVAVSTPQTNLTNQNLSIGHGMDILLVSPAGKVQAYFPYPQHPEQIAEDYKVIVKK